MPATPQYLRDNGWVEGERGWMLPGAFASPQTTASACQLQDLMTEMEA